MKSLLLFFCFSFFLILSATAQDINSSDQRPIPVFLEKRGYVFPDSSKGIDTTANKKWPDTLYYNTPYKSKSFGSITIPFFFSTIEIAKGNIIVNPTVNLGLGYTWFSGDFIFNENDKITVDPKVFYGLFANTGLENGLNLKNGGLFVAGFVGVSSFNLSFGYDIINKSPSIGVGGRIDFYSVSQKFLHILGKVHEVRKHKHIAPQITGE
jgi:hypothetical protein